MTTASGAAPPGFAPGARMRQMRGEARVEANGWERYGRALVAAMSEVLDETDRGLHELLLETADYWLSVGLAIGVERSEDAARLLALIESHDDDHEELTLDAEAFSAEALG